MKNEMTTEAKKTAATLRKGFAFMKWEGQNAKMFKRATRCYLAQWLEITPEGNIVNEVNDK